LITVCSFSLFNLCATPYCLFSLALTRTKDNIKLTTHGMILYFMNFCLGVDVYYKTAFLRESGIQIMFLRYDHDGNLGRKNFIELPVINLSLLVKVGSDFITMEISSQNKAQVNKTHYFSWS